MMIIVEELLHRLVPFERRKVDKRRRRDQMTNEPACVVDMSERASASSMQKACVKAAKHCQQKTQKACPKFESVYNFDCRSALPVRPAAALQSTAKVKASDSYGNNAIWKNVFTFSQRKNKITIRGCPVLAPN